MSGAELQRVDDDAYDDADTGSRPGPAGVSGPASDHGLAITAVTDGKATVVALAGELDLNTASMAERALIAELGPADANLVVDLRRLDFCDAAGLRVFLQVRRHAVAQGARLRFVHAGRTVLLVLEASNLGWLLAEPGPLPPVTPRPAKWCSTSPSPRPRPAR